MLDPTNRTAIAPHRVLSTDPSMKTQRSFGLAKKQCMHIHWMEIVEERMEGRGGREIPTGSTVQ